MSAHQTAALYGKLVLWLRDEAARLLAEAEGASTTEDEKERLDGLIRSWFFDPQDELHGLAPRDIIWAEHKGEPNPVPADRLDDFFDDCPICQQMKEDIEAADAEGHDHSWNWYYDDGGYPLIARYDPEGWDERWAEEDAKLEAWKAEQEEPEPPAPDYEPLPIEDLELDPETFMEVIRAPWLDPALHKAATRLTEHLDIPEPGDRWEPGYRRIKQEEALSLVAGLHRQGVEIDALMDQIEAWPYENIALDWLSEPEQNASLICQALDQMPPDDYASQARFRHHRDFILTLGTLISPSARVWLQGWLDAVVQGAFIL